MILWRSNPVQTKTPALTLGFAGPILGFVAAGAVAAALGWWLVTVARAG